MIRNRSLSSRRHHHEHGAINGAIFAIVALSILVIVFGSFGIWSYMNYTDQKTNVDQKVDTATASAVLKNSQSLEAKFEAREKEPMRQFSGPSDYGSLTFDYPKTWSAYQATDISSGGGVTYAAYLNPVVVPPVTNAIDTKKDSIKFAIRVSIVQATYDQSVDSYQLLVKKGALQSSVYNDGSHTGTKFVGNFSDSIYGTAVLIKMRDRTLTIRTDGDVFQNDYDALLKTVKFNE